MSLKEPIERVDLPAMEKHLSEALENVENESTQYHLREAYQKVVILNSETEQ